MRLVRSHPSFRWRPAVAVAAACVGALIPMFSAATTRATSSGLVAAYSFGEGSGTTVADGSGSGNAGTIQNATWTAAGKYGPALSFNGTSARVTVANASSLQLTSALTLEAWVNPTTVANAWRDVIYKGNDNYYLMGTTDHTSSPGGGALIGGSYSEVFNTSPLPTNTWSYLALTYDGTTERLYLNGALVASKAKTGAITTSTNPLTIGSDPLYGQYFSGLIDEVRVYNAALSQTAIQTDMTTPISGSSTTDTTPPTTPAGLTPGVAGQTSISLSWTASTDNVGVTGYRLFQNGSQVGTSLSSGYIFGGLSCGTAYSLGVAAVDGAGNVSGTASLSVSTAACSDTTAPSAPGALTATAASSAEIDLSWGAATDNVGVTGYRIERCQGAGCTGFVQVGTGAGRSYQDIGLAAATGYSYRVRAGDAAGNLGPYTNTAQATTAAATGGLVAAYSFGEGSGTTVADASGNGNAGTIRTRRGRPSGKYGRRALVQRHQRPRHGRQPELAAANQRV